MTTKDKAKELFDKYCHAIRTEEDDDGYFTNTIQAKRCALISIDQLMTFNKELFWINEGSLAWQYFEDVKKEIEKL